MKKPFNKHRKPEIEFYYSAKRTKQSGNILLFPHSFAFLEKNFNLLLKVLKSLNACDKIIKRAILRERANVYIRKAKPKQ